MRICFFLHHLKAGGIVTAAAALANALSDKGHQIDVVYYLPDEQMRHCFANNVTLINLNCSRGFQAPFRFGRMARQTRYDLIISYGGPASVWMLLSQKLFPSGSKTLFSIHSHYSTERQYLPRWQQLKSLHMFWLEKWLYPCADAGFSPSEGVRADAINLFHLDTAKMHCLPNPVAPAQHASTSLDTPLHPWFSQTQHPVILGCGRLVHQKHFALLIDAFAQLPQALSAKLIILGEGELRTALEAQIHLLGLEESVHLAGYHPQPQHYMRRADLFVLSSYYEGFGNVLVEALAAGAAIVSTDCPAGPSDILGGGRYGRLARAMTPQALANAMQEELKERTISREEAMQRARDFAPPAIAEQAETLFESLLK